MQRQYFNNTFSETIFRAKYANSPTDTWGNLAERVVEDVCGSRTQTHTINVFRRSTTTYRIYKRF